MITKFNYFTKNGLVSRTPDYSFTAIEDLGYRLADIDDENVISNIAATTLKGESERNMIGIEDAWFKIQLSIQEMDAERISLEKKLIDGDSNRNPLNPTMLNNVKARIAELKEGTIIVKKEFYNHYNRETITVDEVIQTPYTIALENRIDLEYNNPYLAGLRGDKTAPKRAVTSLNLEKETEIRKELVRQKIDVRVGDDKDLIADMSHAFSAIIKKVSGGTITAKEDADIAKYITRQTEISGIMAADYIK